jgi:hypothetical protein
MVGVNSSGRRNKALKEFQEEIMSRSRTAIFTARFAALAGAAAIALAVPLLGATTMAGADPDPVPTTTATTNGHEWIG